MEKSESKNQGLPGSAKLKGIAGSIGLAIIAIVFVTRIGRDFCFYYSNSVTKVTSPADFEKLHDNAVAEISLDLDFKNAYSIQYNITQREFVLIPFSGMGHKLMYVVEGPLSDKLNLLPPLKGRVVGKDFGDSWEVFDQQIELEKIFARDHIDLPKGALLVYNAPKEFPGIMSLLLFVLSAAYLVYKAVSLGRFLRPKSETVPPTPAAG